MLKGVKIEKWKKIIKVIIKRNYEIKNMEKNDNQNKHWVVQIGRSLIKHVDILFYRKPIVNQIICSKCNELHDYDCAKEQDTKNSA